MNFFRCLTVISRMTSSVPNTEMGYGGQLPLLQEELDGSAMSKFGTFSSLPRNSSA